MLFMEVKAEIGATVLKIDVRVGDGLKEGDSVVVLEAMKMKLPVVATASAIVTGILSRKASSSRKASCWRVLSRPEQQPVTNKN
jgi:biotin carboxyl carrier protein